MTKNTLFKSRKGLTPPNWLLFSFLTLMINVNTLMGQSTPQTAIPLTVGDSCVMQQFNYTGSGDIWFLYTPSSSGLLFKLFSPELFADSNWINKTIFYYDSLGSIIPIDSLLIQSDTTKKFIHSPDSNSVHYIRISLDSNISDSTLFSFYIGLKNIVAGWIRLHVYSYDPVGSSWNSIGSYTSFFWNGDGSINWGNGEKAFDLHLDTQYPPLSCTPVRLRFVTEYNQPCEGFIWRSYGEYTNYVFTQPAYPPVVEYTYYHAGENFFSVSAICELPNITNATATVFFCMHTTPEVDFTLNPQTVCPMENVWVNWNSTDYINQHIIDHTIYYQGGNPEYVGTNSPIQYSQFETLGQHEVTVTWVNECGSASATQYVNVSYSPTFSYNNVCLGESSIFIGSIGCPNSVQHITQWEWDFGDGSTGSGAIVNHTYASSGTYVVTMTIYDDLGNSESVSQTITVLELPVAEIELQYFNNCTSNSINAWINNPDPDVEYAWNIPAGLGTISPTTGSNVLINWTAPLLLTSPTLITVTATNTVTACVSTTQAEFFPCCVNPLSTTAWSDEIVSTPNNFAYPDQIMINGVVTFEADQIFTGVNLQFGPMAEIIIRPGVDLQFSNCSFLAGCQYMWQGITLSDNSASTEVQNSKIRDAISFVTSYSGGYYNIHDNTELIQNNYVVVTVHGAPSGFSSIFSNNMVTCDPNSMLPPYALTKSFSGISVNNSANVIIGPDNVFNSLQNGIWSEGSQIIVKGNTFKNINNVQIGQTTKAAIYVNSGFPQLLTHGFMMSYIGGSALADGNKFQNCRSGVYAENNQNLEVANNTFTSITQYGVYYAWFNKNASMAIENNTFTNATIGINAYLNSGCISNLLNNTFTWNGNPATATGIKIMGKKFKGEAYNITGNEFNKPRIGIDLSTLHTAWIEYNTINDLRPSSTMVRSFGIRAVNCFSPSILANTITPAHFNMNQPGASSDINTGIQIENTWSAYVNCNVIRKTGICFNVSGANPMTTLTNNDFVKGYYGIFTSNSGYTGDIGDVTHPADNQWLGIANLRQQYEFPYNGFEVMYCRSIGNYLLYFHNSAPYSPIVVSLAPSITPCPQVIIDDPTEKARKTITQDMQQIPYESGIWVKKGMNKIVKNNPLLNNDTLLNEFIDTLKYTSTGLLDSVLVLREAQMLNEAELVNSTLTPYNNMDELDKEMNQFYLVVESEGIQELSVSEIVRIREIASLCPFTDGEAVYKARILLAAFDPIGTEYENICERAVNNKSSIQSDSEGINVITVVPNPSNGTFSLMCETLEGSGALMVYDISGRCVWSGNVEINTLPITLNLLTSGLYHYSFRLQNNVYFGNITIMKE